MGSAGSRPSVDAPPSFAVARVALVAMKEWHLTPKQLYEEIPHVALVYLFDAMLAESDEEELAAQWRERQNSLARQRTRGRR